MKQKVAVMLNTDKLGGAERSLLLQLSLVKGAEYTFFVPSLSEKSGVKEFIMKEKMGEIKDFHYPENIYSLSRSRSFFSFKAMREMLSVFKKKSDLSVLSQYDRIYLNGNKIAFLYFLLNLKNKFKAKVIWHLRDYYHSSSLNNFVWRALIGFNNPDLEIVCNSNSVRNGLQGTPLNYFPSSVIYNPSGEMNNHRFSHSVETIGFVSMIAPWKGIHEVMFFAWMYENELKKMGVKKIKIFGDNIYKTSGDHLQYKNELLALSKKFPTDLISFEGLKEPSEIFNQIDCLIHYSLAPEPFGRVLIEAYEAGVPVITTGLGGAGEILDHGKNGFKVVPYDRRDLLEKVRSLTANNILRFNFISKSKTKSAEIQKDISDSMTRVLALEDVS